MPTGTCRRSLRSKSRPGRNGGKGRGGGQRAGMSWDEMRWDGRVEKRVWR